MEEKQQEVMYQLSFFEQQMNNLNQQLDAIEKAIVEMTSLKKGMDELKGQKGEEILAHLGKGIYVKAELISEEFLVDIGNKSFVKKNIETTKELINEQIEKLGGVKQEIKTNLDELNKEILKMIDEAQHNAEVEKNNESEEKKNN